RCASSSSSASRSTPSRSARSSRRRRVPPSAPPRTRLPSRRPPRPRPRTCPRVPSRRSRMVPRRVTSTPSSATSTRRSTTSPVRSGAAGPWPRSGSRPPTRQRRPASSRLVARASSRSPTRRPEPPARPSAGRRAPHPTGGAAPFAVSGPAARGRVSRWRRSTPPTLGHMRLRLDLAYDGTDFHGWAAPPGLRTVEGELTAALGRVLRLPQDPSVTVAGRTDAGVHAAGQVVHLDLAEEVLAGAAGRSDRDPLDALLTRVRGVLPPDIALHR